MTDKSGGEVNQANFGAQGNVSGQETKGVSNAGPAVVDSLGGAAVLGQGAAQTVSQALGEANLGLGGFGGSDNIEANTAIDIK